MSGKRCRGGEWSQLEDIMIVRKLLELEEGAAAFKFVGGNELWKRIVKSGGFGRRPWSSIRERYLKYKGRGGIREKLMTGDGSFQYLDISQEELEQIRMVDKTRKEKKHKNLYVSNRGREWSRKEDILIVRKLLDVEEGAGAFKYVGGNKLWIRMKKSGAFGKRTWSGLRERYLKYQGRGGIRERLVTGDGSLQYFNITQEEVERIREVDQSRKEQQHGNQCPSYRF